MTQHIVIGEHDAILNLSMFTVRELNVISNLIVIRCFFQALNKTEMSG